MKRNVVVVGGTGFIGEYVVSVLAAEGTSAISVVHHGAVSSDSTQAGVRYIDVTSEHDTEHCLRDADTLLWLAPPVPGLLKRVMSYISPTALVCYASTLLVYPENNIPQNEEVTPVPTTEYEHAKYTEEQYLQDTRTQGLTIARLGNVYGGRKNKGIIGKILAAVEQKETLVIHGDGEQKRDFVHVEDVSMCLGEFVLRGTKHGAIFNVCTGVPHSVNQIVRLVETYAEIRIPVTHVSGGEGKQEIVGDNHKIRSFLGHEFAYDFEKGLQNTLSQYSARI